MMGVQYSAGFGCRAFAFAYRRMDLGNNFQQCCHLEKLKNAP